MNHYRYHILILLFLSYLLLSATLKAAVPIYGIPEVDYFSRADYKGATQNWSISQAENGLLYAANNDGILEYDGSEWLLLPKTTNVIHRSVLAYQNRIYMGAYNEFGYYEYNGHRDLDYTSLSDNDELSALGDVWEIIPFNDWIVFQADKGLVLWKEGSKPIVVSAKARIPKAFTVNGLLIVYDETYGLMEFRQGRLYEIPGGESFAGVSIGAVLPLSSSEILIATITGGIYVWDMQTFKEWDGQASHFLKNANVYSGIEYGEDEFVFGTIQSGVVITDKAGNIKSMINKERGLQNNTVLGLEVDQEGNIWAGLDNGIARISYNSTISFIQGYYDIGTGYTVEEHEGVLYLGTNQALYYINEMDFKNPINDRNSFVRIQGTSGQVWSLFTDKEGQVLCGHNSGVFSINHGRAKLITPAHIVGAWIFRYPPNRTDLCLVGSYNGIIVLRKVDGQWTYVKRLDGFNESARFMEWDSDGALWVTHGYLGAFKVHFDENYNEIVEVETFNDAKGLGKNLSLNVTRVNDEVVFGSSKGVFGYDSNSNSFYRHNLNTYFLEGGFPTLLHSDDNRNVWFFTQNGVGVLRRLEDGNYTKVTLPFYPITGKVVDGFEFVKALDEKNTIFGVEDGFAHYSVNERKELLKPFNVHIRGFKSLNDDVDYFSSPGLPDTNHKPQWPYNQNSFEVKYSATHFETSNTKYSTFVEGLDQNWSEPSLSQRRQIVNIREGNYVFWVKAINVHGQESEPTGLEFIVLPPWYRTVYALVGYILVVIGLIVGAWYLLMWLIERSRLVAVEKQKEHFRIKEEKLKNLALENEKEMIRLRNEKLRDEMLFKEKELANSTMHIIQKNEFLLNIKEELQKINRSREISAVERKVNEIARKIDRDIDNESQWEVFELHLEHVHADFINRLRKQFPDLSSREQKLCAYLRMDMASKEISSLMNISVRAVENNRYKLRKKLGLDAKDNLSDFILSI